MKRWLSRHGITGLAFLLVLAGSIMYVQQSMKLNNATECQAVYNRASAERTKSLRDAADQERTRTQQLVVAEMATWRELLALTGNGAAEQTPEQQAASIAIFQQYLHHGDAYLAASRAAGAIRQDNPLPTLNCRP